MNGIYPALLTPLDPGGSLRPGILEASLERLYRAGCHGVYIAGSTGEGLLLDPELREQLTAATVKATPAGRRIVVHVGANSTATAVRLARHAEQSGAHAISSIAPPGPFSFDDIETYYRDLAAATSLPLILYFFPASAPAVATYAHLQRLCAIPNVAGVKFTSFDLYTLSRIPSELHKFVWNGHDEVLAAGLLMGACGGVGSIYNVEPALFLAGPRQSTHQHRPQLPTVPSPQTDSDLARTRPRRLRSAPPSPHRRTTDVAPCRTGRHRFPLLKQSMLRCDGKMEL